MRLTTRRFGFAAILSLLAAGAAPTTAEAQGCNTTVRFLNQTNRVVQQLFYNPSSTSNWGPDRLGANVIRPGQVYSVRLSQAAPYDFRFVLDNGYAAEARRVNVCAVSELIATAQGLRWR